MENNESGNRATPEEAQDALDSARQADDAVRRPGLPIWFFAVMAALVAVILLAQMLDSEMRMTVMFGALVVALLLNMRMQQSVGVSMASHNFRAMAPFLAIMLVVIFGTAIAAGATETDWIWAVGAGASAIIVLVTGLLYSRRTAA